MSWEASSLYVCAKAKTNDPWKMFVEDVALQLQAPNSRFQD